MAIDTQDYIDSKFLNITRRIRIKDKETGELHDLTKFLPIITVNGIDVVSGWSYSVDVDSAVSSMSFKLGAQARTCNGDVVDLAPLRNPSSVLQDGAEVFLEYEAYINGQSQGFTNEWNGTIGKIVHSNDGKSIDVSCRDSIRWLMYDHIDLIEDSRVYGSTTGVPAETVMIDIMKDQQLPPLVIPEGPAFAIKAYRQEKMSTYEALERIANNFAWVIRAVPNAANNNLWDPTLVNPPRSKVDADYTFTEDFITSVSSVSLSSENIRNSVRVIATNRELFENNQVIDVLFQDSASILKYGGPLATKKIPRHMEIFLDERSQINTVGEATAMANNVLSDTADFKAHMVLTTAPAPFVMTGHLINISETRFFNDDTPLAVTGYKQFPTKTQINLRNNAPVGMSAEGWVKIRKLATGNDQPSRIRPNYQEPITLGSTSWDSNLILTQGVAPVSNNPWVKAAWDIPVRHSVDEFRIRWKPITETEYQPSTPLQENAFTIYDLAANTEYCVSVSARGKDNTWGPWSTDECITTDPDTTPPAAPTGLVCSTTNTGISLTWDVATEIDYSRSVVYVHPTQNPPDQVVGNKAYEGRPPCEITIQGITKLQAETDYNIVVVNVDTSNNVSLLSPVVTCETGRFAGTTTALDGAAVSQVGSVNLNHNSFADVNSVSFVGARIGDVIGVKWRGNFIIQGSGIALQEKSITMQIEQHDPLAPFGFTIHEAELYKLLAREAPEASRERFFMFDEFTVLYDNPIVTVAAISGHIDYGAEIEFSKLSTRIVATD